MDFSILVLGSSAATPTYARQCSAQLLDIHSSLLLVDCGESTQNRLRQYHKRFQAIKAIFISHLHGDHFFGLPGLLSTMHLCGRTEPLALFAPKGAKQVIDLILDASGSILRYPLEITELELDAPAVIYRGRAFSVTAFPLLHSLPTFGFLFEEDTPLLNLRPNTRDKYNMSNDDCVRVKNGDDLVLPDGSVVPNSELTLPPRLPRRYAYCCDTAFDVSIVPIVKGVDLLCTESTFDTAFTALAEERRHCTAAQAATLAAKAEASQLLLTHFSARYRETEPLLDEAKAIFPNTVCATDGMQIDLPCRTAEAVGTTQQHAENTTADVS